MTAMFNEHEDVIVAGVSDGRNDVLSKVRTLQPHIVLMDFGLSGRNSLELMVSIKKNFPGIKIIGMGLVPTQSDIMEFVQAGAEGFITKNATVKDILKTIRTVALGETVLPPSMAGSLFSQVAEHALSKGKRNLKNAMRMTEREKQIIALIVEGMSNKEIADTLHITTFTVKSHVHNILEKLALHNRLQIARYANDDPSI